MVLEQIHPVQLWWQKIVLHRQLPDLRMQLFHFGLAVFCFPERVGKYTGQAINRLSFPHRRCVGWILCLAAISCPVLSPRRASSATAALNLSEKLSLQVIKYPVVIVGYILARCPYLPDHFSLRAPRKADSLNERVPLRVNQVNDFAKMRYRPDQAVR